MERVNNQYQNEENKEIQEIQDAIRVRVDTLNNKIRSKEDMYQLLTGYCKKLSLDILGGFYLPTIEKTPIRFMRDIMSGEKKVSI
jgi:hypothetical protein